jgi:membrane protease YdiL (CAAX protease family)
MALGGVAVFVAWRLVDLGRVSIWVALTPVMAAAAIASVATGTLALSANVAVGLAAVAGLGAGVLLYLATAAFVLIVRRWHVFDRHVAEIYDQRRGLSLGLALLLAAAVNATGEELFWRGLWQSRLAVTIGWPAGAVVTWVAYVLANMASRSLPIAAGAVVGGVVWGALALWTHGVLAPLLCHAVWTALMLVLPPGGPGPVRRRGG